MIILFLLFIYFTACRSNRINLPLITLLLIPGWGTLGNREYRYGHLLYIRGEYEEALRCFIKLEESHPKDPQVHQSKASVLIELGRLEEALVEAQEALAISPTPERLLLRSAVLALLGALEEALRDAEAILNQEANLPTAQALYAGLLIAMGREGEALGFLESRELRLSGDYLTLGEAYRAKGSFDLALAAYREASLRARREAFGLPGKAVLAYALAKEGKLTDAEEMIRLSLTKHGRSVTALSAQALVDKQCGDLDALEKTLLRVLEFAPQEVVDILSDSEFEPLLSQSRFRNLLDEARADRDATLERIRRYLASSEN
ncbi:MAG TPA: hypothetical protein VNL15_05370 [Dehalococcoidia bacterium]|nr:hypothetical protein [Dehalococcoidia bacterium]